MLRSSSTRAMVGMRPRSPWRCATPPDLKPAKLGRNVTDPTYNCAIASLLPTQKASKPCKLRHRKFSPAGACSGKMGG